MGNFHSGYSAIENDTIEEQRFTDDANMMNDILMVSNKHLKINNKQNIKFITFEDLLNKLIEVGITDEEERLCYLRNIYCNHESMNRSILINKTFIGKRYLYDDEIPRQIKIYTNDKYNYENINIY